MGYPPLSRGERQGIVLLLAGLPGAFCGMSGCLERTEQTKDLSDNITRVRSLEKELAASFPSLQKIVENPKVLDEYSRHITSYRQLLIREGVQEEIRVHEQQRENQKNNLGTFYKISLVTFSLGIVWYLLNKQSGWDYDNFD